MGNSILELQNELLKKECDVQLALRKAFIIASRLKMNDFANWVKYELIGYPEGYSKVPEYRHVTGSSMARDSAGGWIPVTFKEIVVQEWICAMNLRIPIGNILELQKSKTMHFILIYTSEIAEMFAREDGIPHSSQYALHVEARDIKCIPDNVTNCLLEWTLKLEEEGISGENMFFTQEETKIANDIPQQINNYYGTVINGSVSQSQVVSGNSNTLSYNAEDIESAIKEINESIDNEDISGEDKEMAVELLNEISQKLAQGKKPRIIKAALVGLKDFVLATGANVTTALITSKIQGLF